VPVRGLVPGWPLVIRRILKIACDLLLLMQFRHVKPPEAQVTQAASPKKEVP